MKKRLFDRESWRQKSFRDMAGWAQLLHIHMYLELADFAGIAELDLHLASYNIKMMGIMPENMDEVAEELKARWTRIGECLFIRKHFLGESQGQVIKLLNNAHVYILKDMYERWKHGLHDVKNIVLEHNPSIRFQTIKQAEEQINQIEAEAQRSGNKDKINGMKSSRKALEDARCYADVLQAYDLPSIENAEEDPSRPNMHPDQSKPIQQVSQEAHDRAIQQGYYMIGSGQYVKPLISN